ncbi:hypothetical protein, partial [Paraclostridium bifermentans]|uniref:hypothetical protein n=1 Tax=Paraclostridium bifermentans TaxID=1490 RepID=UPI002FCCECCF
VKLENIPESAKIKYRTHVQDIGWQDWKSNGELSGTEGQSKRLEAIEVKLENMPGYHLEYRVHVQNAGWVWRYDEDKCLPILHDFIFNDKVYKK